jgi:hypothetical protein
MPAFYQTSSKRSFASTFPLLHIACQSDPVPSLGPPHRPKPGGTPLGDRSTTIRRPGPAPGRPKPDRRPSGAESGRGQPGGLAAPDEGMGACAHRGLQGGAKRLWGFPTRIRLCRSECGRPLGAESGRASPGGWLRLTRRWARAPIAACKVERSDWGAFPRGSGFAGPNVGAPWGQERSDWGADYFTHVFN